MSSGTDIVISFDTTGSMYPCLSQVRRQVQETVQRLFRDIPDLRVGIIAHGDYCDGARAITKFDLSSSQRGICAFVRSVQSTFGGDAPECYELALYEARTFGWRSGTTKALVMIGDDVPHGPHERQNTRNLDWRNELDLLLEAGIHVYAVQALARYHATAFWKEMAKRTGGFHLELHQFRDVVDMLLAIAYKQQGAGPLFKFEQEVQQSGRYSPRIELVFATLSRGERAAKVRRATYAKPKRKRSKLAEVNPSRFQALEVDDDCDIKGFVEEQGVTFRAGRGFYQLTKAVKVQDHKEIILEDKETGDMFTGQKARDMLGLPHRGTVSLNPRDVRDVMRDYLVYIQSTSYNRKLLADTWFLYELSDYDRVSAC